MSTTSKQKDCWVRPRGQERITCKTFPIESRFGDFLEQDVCFAIDHPIRDNVKRERPEEQAVPMDGLLGVNRFEDFLKARAEKLAEFATAYVQSLAK